MLKSVRGSVWLFLRAVVETHNTRVKQEREASVKDKQIPPNIMKWLKSTINAARDLKARIVDTKHTETGVFECIMIGKLIHTSLMREG